MSATAERGALWSTMARGVAAALLAALAALVLATPAAGKVRGFSLGVAAGEVAPRSVKVWGHADGNGKVRAKLALDRRFREVAFRAGLRARGRNDGTVKKTFRGLTPGTEYWYRFCAGPRVCSDKGRVRTAPLRGRTKRIKFALSGDADATAAPGETKPFYGNFLPMKAMRRERNDFNVFMGDTIYSDSGVAGKPALTVAQKWRKYVLGLEQRHLRKLRGSAGLYSHWDDHEFINDFSIPEHGRKLYRAGRKAFTDYAPVGYSKQRGLYRSFRWGKNVELFFLDERSFRSAKADAGGTCENPESGDSDLAPTAPDDKRALFSVLIPSLAQPVSQQCKNAINNPKRTLLGRRQLNRFITDVDRSKARWKLIMNETPIQQFYGLPYDRWEGYAHERVELLQRLERRGATDVVFFTTDTHAAFANVVRERTFAGDVAPANARPTPRETPFSDYVIGPVATATYWREIDDTTGGEGNGELLSQAFFKPPPPDGVGMACSQGDQFSYAQVSAGKRNLKIAYKTGSGETVTDVDGSDCGPYTLKR
jgi:alkaline phosphatase D